MPHPKPEEIECVLWRCSEAKTCTRPCEIGRFPHVWEPDCDREVHYCKRCEVVGFRTSAAGTKPLRWNGDRSHEECANCSLESSEPIQCEGHPHGETACKLFTEKSAAGTKGEV